MFVTQVAPRVEDIHPRHLQDPRQGVLQAPWPPALAEVGRPSQFCRILAQMLVNMFTCIPKKKWWSYKPKKQNSREIILTGICAWTSSMAFCPLHFEPPNLLAPWPEAALHAGHPCDHCAPLRATECSACHHWLYVTRRLSASPCCAVLPATPPARACCVRSDVFPVEVANRTHHLPGMTVIANLS